MKSLLRTGLRYASRFVIVPGVCILLGFGIGTLLGSGGLGAMAGVVIALCITLVAPGPARSDGPECAQHTASTVGRDVGVPAVEALSSAGSGPGRWLSRQCFT